MTKRWKILDNIFLVSLGLIVFFAWMDVKQITTFFIIDTEQAWLLYNQYTGPAIWSMWYVVLAAIGVVWYIIYKDKSEAVSLVASTWALLWFGVQDVFYFIFSEQAMTTGMCWADTMMPIRVISNLLGEVCPSRQSFLLSAALGVFVANKVYNYFKKAKW